MISLCQNNLSFAKLSSKKGMKALLNWKGLREKFKQGNSFS